MPEERGRKGRSIDRDAVGASLLTEEQEDTIVCLLSVHDDDDGRETSTIGSRKSESADIPIEREGEQQCLLNDDSELLTSSQK
jgi:hypothetical protein